MKKRKLVYIETSIINKRSFNPPKRIIGAAFKKLRDSIIEFGILSPISIVKEVTEDENGIEKPTGEYIVGDGHRRLTVAELIGLELVPCIVMNDMTPNELYQQQFSARNPRGAEIGYVWAMQPKALPKWHLNKYNRFAKMVGEDLAKTECIRGDGVGPYTIVKINQFVRLVLDKKKGKPINWDDDQEACDFAKKTFLWMQRHKGGRKFVHEVVVFKWFSIQKLRSIIEEDISPKKVMDGRYSEE